MDRPVTRARASPISESPERLMSSSVRMLATAEVSRFTSGTKRPRTTMSSTVETASGPCGAGAEGAAS